MGETGVLDQDERLELIHGQVFRMSPIGSLHAKVVNRLNKRLSQRLFQAEQSDLIISVQNPVQLREDSEPVPDLALLASEGSPGQYPAPHDILLIVEVADTSLEHDQDTKLPLYASAGIPEYWLVNLSDRSVDVYREPEGDTYTRRTRHRNDDSLRLATVSDLGALPVRDIFPDETKASDSSK